MYYQLGSKLFKDYIELTKSGSTFFGISQESVGQYPTIIPPLIEQKAIAQILSEMDAETEALETRQAKYKAVKQGMMQELLMGKTRLV
ncbi:MAG: restriction endonuclease subunit S [Pyrinomonadaceae bacterium]|nr:restriction endonuclease subunit S [Pyrinomonadaceae bacterium]